MVTTEERVDRLEEKYSNLHTVVNVLASKVDATNQRIDDFISEMRQQNAMRAQENTEIRQSIKEIYQTTDAKISKIETKIDGVTNHIQILTVTAMAGIAAIAIAVFLK